MMGGLQALEENQRILLADMAAKDKNGRVQDLLTLAKMNLSNDRGQEAVGITVHGKVKAGHVIINGLVVGPVESTELLELQPKARIVGDVRYESLEMHQGATIDGELRPLKSEDKPALKLAASNAG